MNNKLMSTEERQRRFSEMRKLRFEQGMTIQKIADDYGISRERVRQIIGNTGWIANPENMFVEKKQHTVEKTNKIIEQLELVDAPNMTTRELSELTGIDYCDVSRLRPVKRHRVEGKLTALGMKAEEYVSLELSRRGIGNKLMYNFCPYDIELGNGKTVDVKSRSHCQYSPMCENFFFFVLVRKDRKEKDLPDFFALVIGKDIFMIPKNEVPKSGALGFSWPPGIHKSAKNWQQYHNRFDLLTDL